MSLVIWAGTVLGLVIGLLHGAAMFRCRQQREGASAAEATYFAVWTVALWTLFGAYVLVFWLIGLAGLAVSSLFKRSGAVS